ncbi:MAG: MBL fold metallo-hydrolase [Candidatus Moranbacteria bacterium]|nr:MBL fold metallo-hydrolase [Candidatus Moranbacteria bacterium]
MSKRQIYSSFIFLILLSSTITLSLFWFHRYESITTVTFLSVGEGDAILISQGSNQILIDGGRRSKDLLSHLGRHIPFWDRTIETVIATHPDADHIGGLPDLARTYTVNQFLFTGAESETDIFSLLRKSLEENHVTKDRIFEGSLINLPRGGTMEVLFPDTPLPPETKESNKGSLVIRFTYGETMMLFTGDLPSEEMFIPNTGPIDILKVSHHGSRYSTSSVFLGQITPKEAIISVGKNSYRHPSPDVLKRLEEKHIVIRRTDQDGDIQYICTEVSHQCAFVK